MKIMREKIVEAVSYKGDVEVSYLNINGYECYVTLPLSYLIDTEESVSISINNGYLILNDKKIDVYDILRLKRKYEEEEDEEDEYDEEEDEE